MNILKLRKSLKNHGISVEVFTNLRDEVSCELFSGLTVEAAHNFLVNKEFKVSSDVFTRDFTFGDHILNGFSSLNFDDLAFKIWEEYAKRIGSSRFLGSSHADYLKNNVSLEDEFFDLHDNSVLYDVIVDKFAEIGYNAKFDNEMDVYNDGIFKHEKVYLVDIISINQNKKIMSEIVTSDVEKVKRKI